MTQLIKPFSAEKMAVRTALILLAFVLVFTALLSGAYLWTRPAIESAAATEKLKLVNEVLPPSRYDNTLLEDYVTQPATPALGTDEPTRILRARKDGKAIALVLEAIAPDGYSGKIQLILAINRNGNIAGVRVTQHKETPGLGDYIDPKKDKNKTAPWISQFNGLNPSAMPPQQWKVKKDGGQIDSLAGATVSPRAVTKAIYRAALFVKDNHARLFDMPTDQK